MKACLEQSEGEVDIELQVMKHLRLINRHWSSWTTGAIGLLRPGKYNVPLDQSVKLAFQKLVNVRILVLNRTDMITDREMQSLRQMSNLTQLDLPRNLWLSARPFTEAWGKSLETLTTLRHLNLGGNQITDAEVQHMTSLELVTKLGSYGCGRVTDKGLMWLGMFKTLRDLDLRCSNETADAGLGLVTSLSCLPNFDLHCSLNIRNRHPCCLEILIALGYLNLANCVNVANDGVS